MSRSHKRSVNFAAQASPRYTTARGTGRCTNLPSCTFHSRPFMWNTTSAAPAIRAFLLSIASKALWISLNFRDQCRKRICSLSPAGTVFNPCLPLAKLSKFFVKKPCASPFRKVFSARANPDWRFERYRGSSAFLTGLDSSAAMVVCAAARSMPFAGVWRAQRPPHSSSDGWQRPSAFVSSTENESSKRRWHVEIWLFGERRTPRRIKPWLLLSFDPVKVCAPHLFGIELVCQALHRQGQFGSPGLLLPITIHFPAHPAAQILLLARGDAQVNPKSIRAYFKFQVTLRIASRRLQKNLRYISVPQLTAPSILPRIRKNGHRPVSRMKIYEQILRRPEQPNLRHPLWIIFLPPPVLIEPQNWRATPIARRRKTVRIQLLR